MTEQLNYTCALHQDNCPRQVLKYVPAILHEPKVPSSSFTPWIEKAHIRIIARNGEYKCNFCPSCGSSLDNID